MNCGSAQDILSDMLDGNEPALAREAMDHLRECERCREWHSSMMRVVGALSSSPEPPLPDIAGMVMRSLPPRHPASSGGRAVRRPSRLLAWLAAGWAAGAVLVAITALVASQSLSIGGIGHAFHSVRGAAGGLGVLMDAGRALFQVVGHTVLGMARAASGFGPYLMWFLIADLAALAVIAMVWRGRRGTVGVCAF